MQFLFSISFSLPFLIPGLHGANRKDVGELSNFKRDRRFSVLPGSIFQSAGAKLNASFLQIPLGANISPLRMARFSYGLLRIQILHLSNFHGSGIIWGRQAKSVLSKFGNFRRIMKILAKKSPRMGYKNPREGIIINYSGYEACFLWATLSPSGIFTIARAGCSFCAVPTVCASCFLGFFFKSAACIFGTSPKSSGSKCV